MPGSDHPGRAGEELPLTWAIVTHVTYWRRGSEGCRKPPSGSGRDALARPWQPGGDRGAEADAAARERDAAPARAVGPARRRPGLRADGEARPGFQRAAAASPPPPAPRPSTVPELSRGRRWKRVATSPPPTPQKKPEGRARKCGA